MMGGSWDGGVRAFGPEDEDIEPRLCGNWSGRGREWVRSNKPHLLHSTFPGLRFDLRHVEVSVVQQLKHLLRTLSLSLVVASSVCMTLGDEIGMPSIALLPSRMLMVGLGAVPMLGTVI